ncbi:MAG: MFS transporter [Gammaproteobacteria bacterium]
MTTQQPQTVSKRALFVISLCAGFLFYKYILQVYPSIITNELMRDFNLTGAGLGNLAATFYYTLLVMQLFVGVMLDKWSTRVLTCVAIMVCAVGTIVFAQSHSNFMACASRGLMGIGVAFATVAYMKLAAVWFPANRYAVVGGLLATAAMTGAVFGEAPLSYLISYFGWREAMLYVGFAGVILALLFLFVVRDSPFKITSAQPKDPFSWQAIIVVLKDKRNWLLTFYSGLAFSPLVILGGLWGNPFFQTAYHVNATTSGAMVSLVFIGLGIGSPVIGWISDYWGNRLHVMIYSMALSFVCLAAVFYVPGLPLWLLSTLLFLFGFFLGTFMLAFAIGKEINSLAVTATVIAMINASDAILDAITEPAIGKFLDWRSHGVIVNGMHYFTAQDYRYALSVLPLYLLLALVCLIWLNKCDYQQSSV